LGGKVPPLNELGTASQSSERGGMRLMRVKEKKEEKPQKREGVTG